MIIAFTKDWNDVPTCTTHILREMAKTIPVLWIESIGTRKPNLSAGSKDVGRVISRLKRLLKGAAWKEHHLWVLSPLLIPKASKGWELTANRILFRLQERAAMRRMTKSAPPTSELRRSTSEYWCFVPNAVDLLPKRRAAGGKLKAEMGNRKKSVGRQSESLQLSRLSPQPSRAAQPLVIYYCVDDWTQFHNLDGEYLGRKELQLVARANIIFAASGYLVRRIEQLASSPPQLSAFSPHPSGRPKVVYSPHGVEHAKFAAALSSDTAVPADIANIPHPIIGFYGNLHSWVDLSLVSKLARQKAEWQFILIGHPYDDVSAVQSLTNVHLLGRREHDELPAYCKAFDVAMIPYDMSQARMESVNPIKTKELLAAGRPIVAAAVPELEGMGADVLIARTTEEWAHAIDQQLGRNDHRAISDRVRADDWTPKIQDIRDVVAAG